MVAATPRPILPCMASAVEESARIRSVMATFCTVRNRFSPYVEKGNRFLEAYARDMAYAAVSSNYVGLLEHSDS